MLNRKRQIKFYTDILKENEILLLNSHDSFFKAHYSSSPLAKLTGFLGSAGEAIIEKSGKIKLFVDPRYHLLVEKQAFEDVEIFKMNLGEAFLDCLKKNYKKNTILHLPSDISLKDYYSFDKYFDIRKYQNKKKYIKNEDLNKKIGIFKVDEKINFLKKVEKLKKINTKISKMLIFNLDEISYLTNLRSYQMKYSSNFASILFLDFTNSKHVLFLDKIPKKIKIEGLEFKLLNEFKNFINAFDDEIYFDFSQITLENFLSIKLPKELKNKGLATLASIKQNSEIEILKDSFANLDKAILNFKNKIKFGLSEFELNQIFENELYKIGAKQTSFKTILAINENTASIHYSEPSKNKILKEDSILLLDCGGYFKAGLATDITRTLYFGKKPKPIYRKIYTNVLKAFLACYLSQEKSAKKLDNLARTMLQDFNKDGFYFNHGLGHGIGTSVHQNPPVLSINSKDTIKPYQVHSIEPGLYGKDDDGVEFGVRIENCVYSDLNFNKISLSKFPFEEVLIDYSLLNKKEIDAIKSWQAGFNE